MSFSAKEREARHKAFIEMMKENELSSLILIGDTNVGPGVLGDLRYYTDLFVIFYRQIVVLFLHSEPVLFAFSEISRQAAQNRSSGRDCHFTEDLIGETIKLLKQRGVGRGRVGVNFDMLPLSWFNILKRDLPDVELIDCHDSIMKIRLKRSLEEMDVLREGAKLGDGGFEAALKIIKPGGSEFEIAAAIEHYARANGAESHFTLIGSGKFALGDENAFPLPYSPSSRRIEKGDSILMEIIPRYRGYWTQLVRTVNVGEHNKDLEKLKNICESAIKEALKNLKPKKL